MEVSPWWGQYVPLESLDMPDVTHQSRACPTAYEK